jgi:hypothetical protein
MTDFPSFSEDEQSRIAEFVPASDRQEVILTLEVVWFEYLIIKSTSLEKLESFRRIQGLLRDLAQEMVNAHGPPDPSKHGDYFHGLTIEGAASALLDATTVYAEKIAREISNISSSRALRSGNKLDPYAEFLYSRVLAVWTEQAHGQLVRFSSDGPQARFFKAALAPILKNSCPKSKTTLDGIFEREWERRNGRRERFWANAPRAEP